MVDQDSTRYVSLPEVKNILKKIEKNREELIYSQRIALEHAQTFSKLSLKDNKALLNELTALESIEEVHAYKIAEILPTDEDAVKAIFAKERTNPSENDLKKILEIVRKYYIE